MPERVEVKMEIENENGPILIGWDESEHEQASIYRKRLPEQMV